MPYLGDVMKEVNYLAEWLGRYLKNRDLYFKKIIKIEQKEDILAVEEKERTVTYFIMAFTDDLKKTAEKMDAEKCYGIALYNTQENLKALLAAWSSLAKIKNLIVYFINPFSKLEKKWVIYPYTHNRISDSESLKLGLQTMFETVEPVSKEEVSEIVK